MNSKIDIKHPYAGFWIRVIASLIDTLILIVPSIILITAGDPGILSFLVGFLYYTIFESSSAQGTLGKRAVGTKIIDEYGNRISYGRAVGRYFGKYVSAFIIGIGFLMVGWTKRKQGLHDMMCGTLVVYSSKLPEQDNSYSAIPKDNNLKGQNLRGQDLRGQDFKNADLRGVDMSNANLSGADLRGANLISAKLIGAKMVGANLRGANLIDANLVEADLREADLSEAILDGVNLAGAKLEGTIGIPNSSEK